MTVAGPTERRPRRRLERLTRDGEVAGVCAGLGVRFAVDPVFFRIAFVFLAVAGGVGFVVYGLAAVFVPRAHGEPPRPPRRDVRRLAGLVLITVAGIGVAQALGLWWNGAVLWPLVLAGLGLLVLYGPGSLGPGRGSVRGRLRDWRDGVDGAATRGTAARVLVGGGLVLAAGLAFLQSTGRLAQTGRALAGLLVILLALSLVFGPWLLRLLRTLGIERRERIRSQERAEMAAHLHDSVLQTLSLIQRRAEDPQEVTALARRQERELRGWLSSGSANAPTDSVAAALHGAAVDVEVAFGVPIEVVAVGDRPLDDRHTALVGAAREAMVNAARFAGPSPVAVFLDASGPDLEVFVRDRGPGFDLDDVPADRRGVRESIVGRMERHGGQATINAIPGAGTEIVLRMEPSS